MIHIYITNYEITSLALKISSTVDIFTCFTSKANLNISMLKNELNNFVTYIF